MSIYLRLISAFFRSYTRLLASATGINSLYISPMIRTEIPVITNWKQAEKDHVERLNPIIEPYLKARSNHARQPVTDFLFEYYSFRAGKLLSWGPGIQQAVSHDWTPSDKLYKITSDGWLLVPADFPQKRASSLDWIIQLQQTILKRPVSFGCFGLHEWAMVYKAEEVRHEQLHLRMKSSEIAKFVDSQNIICSHFDAYRFFTDEAKPLNKLQPDVQNRIDFEQGGCIHANMDLYKWSYKFYPWVSSDLLAEAFLLAWDTREVDMMASPYDLSDYGLNPIRIETEEGRAEYKVAQKRVADRGRILRERLVSELLDIQKWAGGHQTATD